MAKIRPIDTIQYFGKRKRRIHRRSPKVVE
jgi:hypothetical protein